MRYSACVRGFTVLFLLFILTACGNNEGSDPDNGSDIGTGSGDAIQDVLDTFSSVRVTLRNPLIMLIAPTSVSQHVHCSSGGQANMGGTISGTSSEGTFALTGDFDYQSCDGLNGDATYEGIFFTSDDQRNFTGVFDGQVGGYGCLTTLAGTTYSFPLSSDIDIIEPPTSGTIEGTLTADCTESAGDASVTCTWASGTDVNNSAELSDGCTCSGSGC